MSYQGRLCECPDASGLQGWEPAQLAGRGEGPWAGKVEAEEGRVEAGVPAGRLT